MELIPSKSNKPCEPELSSLFCLIPSLSFSSFRNSFPFFDPLHTLCTYHLSMATFTSSSSSFFSSPSPSLSHIQPFSAPPSSAAFDDCSDDACSICLEPFASHDPATITSCKHEYHLHCILEWSQRSKECPICWQLLSLKDPNSQELLTAVEAEKCVRSRNAYSSAFTNSRSPSDESDFDEKLMQQLVAAAASRTRYVHRRGRQRYSGEGPSEASMVQPTLTTNSPTSGVSSSADIQPPTSAFSPVDFVARNTTTSEGIVPIKPSRPPVESPRRLNTSEMFSFPESFKSKISAASARYKESITKSTRGLKEKLVARNASVKELSKGVQREMNAGIAGVARMIERLDLTSKRPTSPSEDGVRVLVCNVTSDTPSVLPSMVSGGVEIHPSNVQSGE